MSILTRQDVATILSRPGDTWTPHHDHVIALKYVSMNKGRNEANDVWVVEGDPVLTPLGLREMLIHFVER